MQLGTVPALDRIIHQVWGEELLRPVSQIRRLARLSAVPKSGSTSVKTLGVIKPPIALEPFLYSWASNKYGDS